MLDAEIVKEKRHMKSIEASPDLAVLAEFDQYLATMREMAEIQTSV